MICFDLYIDHEIMEKPSEVVEKMHHRQVTSGNNELQVCKELLDAEKLAIELLAVRLAYYSR